MRKTLIIILLTALFVGLSHTRAEEVAVSKTVDSYQLYIDMDMEGKVDFNAFQQAVSGYKKIKGKKKDLITLIDFTKPSSEQRLFIIDMKENKLLMRSYVAHGRNSGDNYATSFSNVSGSNKSSLGFYLTGSTYQGRNGYSMRLVGLEKGVNDNALSRAIVVHGALYCNPAKIAASGRLGRSLGCPALPFDVNRKIIDLIKDGSVMYIYANDKGYLSQSSILSPPSNATAQLK